MKSIKDIGSHENNNDFAIIGLGLKIADVDTLDDYWNIFVEDQDCVRQFPKLRKEQVLSFAKKFVENPTFEDGNFLSQVDEFDYEFFNITPREASVMEPAHRIFLQTVFKAFEDAGYTKGKIKGTKTGIFVGYSYGSVKDSYLTYIMLNNPSLLEYSHIANLPSTLPARISYLLDLHGPVETIDTACSSSLVAIHQACMSIEEGASDMAMAGGIKLNLLPINSKSAKIGFESSDGKTRAFDVNSDGAGIGEGVGCILIKKLSAAERDGDPIYCVIKGSAVNHDGQAASLTAPNPTAQTSVILEAWKQAKINPEDIGYVETHGTGTGLGDPIEIQGLKNAFRKYTEKKQFCALSASKSHLGHLYEASGIASVILAIAALNHEEIPGVKHFHEPNENINFCDSPFYVNAKNRKWKSSHKRMCAISAFGITGTNSHLVLGEYDNVSRKFNEKFGINLNLITFSAKSKWSLNKYIEKFKNYLEKTEDSINDIVYTLNSCKDIYKKRLAIIFLTKKDLIDKLANIQKLVSKKSSDVYENDNSLEIHDNYSQQFFSNINIAFCNKDIDIENLKNLAKLFVAGKVGQNEWSEIYNQVNSRRVHVPTYQFKKNSCWIDTSNNKEAVCSKKSNLFYQLNWIPSPLNKREGAINGTLLLFIRDYSKVDQLINNLKMKNINIIKVILSDRYLKMDNNNYVIDSSVESYVKLFNNVKSMNIVGMIHMSTLHPHYPIIKDKGIQLINEGFFDIINLIKGMSKCNFNDKYDLIIISENANIVSHHEKQIIPENAMVLSVGKVIEQEYPNINCSALDIEYDTLISKIVDEVLTSNNKDYLVAYRNNVRYVQQLNSVSIEASKTTPLRNNGTYVITGGTGGIGLEIAKDISKQVKCNIVLISRHGFPPESCWNELKEKSEYQQSIIYFKEIRNNGCNLDIISCDITNFQATENTFNRIRTKYHEINGIYHAAGVMGAGYILRKDKKDAMSVLGPKVFGIRAIDNATMNDQIDFVVLFSSAVIVVGEAGQSDYVAANAFLNSYADYRNMKGKNTIVINWGSWQSAGMSVKSGTNIDSISKAIPTEKAVGGLNQILAHGLKNVLVGELNTSMDLIKISSYAKIEVSEELIQGLKKAYEKNEPFNQNNLSIDSGHFVMIPQSDKKKNIKYEQGLIHHVKLTGDPKDSYTDTELNIGDIYRETLGYDTINVYDNFFAMGGDSIMLAIMNNKVKEIYSHELVIANYFEHSTIRSLADYIDSLESMKH